MDPPKPCRYRYLEKGRTYCAIAITERKYTTREVTPAVCRDCTAMQVVQDHGCRHLDLGVEIDEFQGRTEVSTFFAACRVTVERLTSVEGCRAEACRYWEPLPSDE
jgi:hypothetical protein